MPTDPGGSVWLARRNVYVADNEKHWTVELIGKSSDRYGADEITGYDNGNPPGEVPVSTTTGVRNESGPPKKRVFTFTLRPQPKWELVKLVRSAGAGGGDPVYLKVRSSSHCAYVAPQQNGLSTDEGRFGVPGEDHLRITEIYLFPVTASVNVEGEHWLNAPPHTGTWSVQFTTVDPHGGPRPNGGMRYFVSGPGLTTDDVYSLSMAVVPEENRYEMWAFDAEAGRYEYYVITIGDVIPAVSIWGMITMGLVILVAGQIVHMRRRLSFPRIVGKCESFWR